MRKLKLFITFLLLYECVILTILQIPKYCLGLFNIAFCTISFRYFLMCFMVPVFFGIFLWWLPDISRLFCPQRCKYEPESAPDIKIQDVLHEIISKIDIERLIMAAVVMGIQNFSKNHPRAQNAFDYALDALQRAKNKTKKSK